MGMLLHDPVVPMYVEPLTVVRLEVRIGRLAAESTERLGEMPVVDNEWVARFGMLVETFRQQDARPQVHRSSPELRKSLALDLDMFDVFRVLRRIDGCDLLIQYDPNRLPFLGIDEHFDRRAVQVARRPVPMLTLTAIHRQLDRVPVGPVERFVAVKNRLYDVLPEGHVR